MKIKELGEYCMSCGSVYQLFGYVFCKFSFCLWRYKKFEIGDDVDKFYFFFFKL